MRCALMGCSLIKKGVVGAALVAGASYLAFGTSAPSYIQTAFLKVRQGAKDAMPASFEIDRAKVEVANLEPAIKEGISQYVQAQYEIETLTREIAATRTNLEAEKTAMQSLRAGLESGETRLVGSIRYTNEEVKADLARRLDSYRANARLVDDKESTLKAKTKTLKALKDQLNQMAATKKQLTAKIEGIEARLKMIETTRSGRDFHFDDSALARAKESVTDLEKRLDVMSRVAELEGKYSEGGLPISIEPGRDVAREIDAEFGPPANRKATDKSL